MAILTYCWCQEPLGRQSSVELPPYVVWGFLSSLLLQNQRICRCTALAKTAAVRTTRTVIASRRPSSRPSSFATAESHGPHPIVGRLEPRRDPVKVFLRLLLEAPHVLMHVLYRPAQVLQRRHHHAEHTGKQCGQRDAHLDRADQIIAHRSTPSGVARFIRRPRACRP